MSVPRLKNFIALTTWIGFIGGVLVIVGIIVGVFAHSAFVGGCLLVLGALFFGVGFQARWRGNQIITELTQKQSSGPLDAIDLYRAFNRRRDFVIRLIYAVVVVVGILVFVIIFARR